MTRAPDISQGLEKGLDVLAFLNSTAEAAIIDVVRGVGLPRTTTLRVLETLRSNGYVERVGGRKAYRLTIKVRSLSDGFDDESWITDIARPHLRRLSKTLIWPTLIATPAGSSMLWRESTDHESPLAINRYAVGMRMPVLESASGHVYLAHCSAEEFATVMELCLMAGAPAVVPDLTTAQRLRATVRQRATGSTTGRRSARGR